MQLVESLEKMVFPMPFIDKLNSVSHFCLQFKLTTCSAIFGVSCSKFVRCKPFFAILGQLGSQPPIISRWIYLKVYSIQFETRSFQFDTKNSELKVVAFPFLDGAREKSCVNYL